MAAKETFSSATRGVGKVFDMMWRRRHYEGSMTETKLKRCLRTTEMTFFGVANMIGCGIFVLTGTLLQIAGPAAVLSYILAGFSGILAGMCYAELAGIIPKAGSCYTYTYFALGELFAFIIGWTMISDLIVSFAAISKAFSGALDVLLDNAISNGTLRLLGPIDVPVLSPYPDFVAFGLVTVLVAIVACGAKDSLIVNTTMMATLLLMLAIIIISTFVFGSHFEYWTDATYGGFMPFGFKGVLEGASICVFAFAGFDSIANTSEEARKPQYSIPRAIGISLIVVAVLYCSACAGLSLLVTRETVDVRSPFAYAFLANNQTWVYYISGVAAMIATADVSGLYSLPRMMYALAMDGLLFPIFAYVNERTKVPLVSLIIGGLLTGLMALFIDISSLAEMTSVGLLLSYSTVGINILVVRYNGMLNDLELLTTQKSISKSKKSESMTTIVQQASCESLETVAAPAVIETCEPAPVAAYVGYPRFRKRFAWMYKVCAALKVSPKRLCNGTILVFTLSAILVSILVVYGMNTENAGLWWFISAFLLPSAGASLVLAVLLLVMFKSARKAGAFNIPLMPFTPCLSILINVFLIVNIQFITWVRFIVWTVVGLVIYFGYGIRHSTAGKEHGPMHLGTQPKPNSQMEFSKLDDAELARSAASLGTVNSACPDSRDSSFSNATFDHL